MIARQPIRLLPASVAARIAAGEVIERPASVVKELVENALDAGARQIRIDVRGGGLTLIRVGDDGHGIPAAELPLAVQRHATSKLPDDDLSLVASLGFRGEALPSIATVAELTLASAADRSGIGRRLTLRDGALVADEPTPQPPGTTVTVRGLFQNLPARRAAVQRVQAEAAQIVQTARRLALAAPAVRMGLTLDERPALQTSGSGDLATTLVEIYGPTLAGRLLPLEPLSVAGAQLRGVVASPSVTRPSRGQVHIIVNGRWTQPRSLLSQLEAAYRPLLPRGRHPILVVAIDLPGDRVDINVHPAKLEVRLLDEASIGAAVADQLRQRLGRQPHDLRLATGASLLVPDLAELWPATAPGPGMIAEAGASWDDEPPITSPGLPALRLIGQLHGRLLLLEGPVGLCLVDQHRAHERILYEHLRAQHGAGEPAVEPLPEPLLLELTPALAARLHHRLPELATLGFDCELFGGHTFLLRSAPRLPGIATTEPAETLSAAVETDSPALRELLTLIDGSAGDGEDWRERLLVHLSCRTAIRRGLTLSRPQMRALIERLGHTAAPAVCPHGSPLLIQVSDRMLERQFGWR